MARLVLAAQVCVLLGLASATPACCCGSGGWTVPTPGPPGTITGRIHRPSTGTSGAVEVYALEGLSLRYYSPVRYVATHVPATASSYSLTVPPGGYFVVARLDGELLGGGGATEFTTCSQRGDCDRAQGGHTSLIAVQVESGKVLSGRDIGDWAPLFQTIFWNIDTNGSPLPHEPWVTPSPQSLESRKQTFASAIDPTAGFANSYFGISLQIPVGWTQVKAPTSNRYRSYADGIYFANEQVSAPGALDSGGIWLTIRKGTGIQCPRADWRYATSSTSVTLQDIAGATDFFFEDPPPRDGPQPFVGYKVHGCVLSSGSNLEFILTGVTRDALENNVGAFFRMIRGAQFTQPGPRTPQD